jgi:hypothetical protein
VGGGGADAETYCFACRYAGRKVMLGVDRLDMIKGIPQVGAGPVPSDRVDCI